MLNLTALNVEAILTIGSDADMEFARRTAVSVDFRTQDNHYHPALITGLTLDLVEHAQKDFNLAERSTEPHP